MHGESPRWSLRFVSSLGLVAVLAAAFAIVFRGSLRWALHAFGATDVVAFLRSLPPLARVALPAVGGLLAGLVGLLVARAPAGQGVADVMEAVVVGRVRLSMPVTLLKSLGSFFAIATGGSLGREGPLIQFGGASGHLVGRKAGLADLEVRALIAAGTAAGFAAAYNTPLAAVLFVVEVVTGVMALDVVAPALMASVVASTLARAVAGPGPVYGERAFHLERPAELLAFAGLGVLVGVVAVGFMKLLSASERAFQPLALPYRPMVGGALAGLVVAVLPEVAGNGFEPLNSLLDGQLAVWLVAALLVGKAVATSASVSSGSPGGVFTPTLLLGGATGFLYASALSKLGVPLGGPGGYALVGMAAATAAMMHAPLLAAVMVFELSGDYAVVLPLALATSVATIVARRLGTQSLYMAELGRRGLGWQVTMAGRELDDGRRT